MLIRTILLLPFRSGIDMSELLYIFGEIDPRLRPLVFTVRTWARKRRITYSIPGKWISNFGLTLLVIFFMQQRHGDVLPSAGEILRAVEKSKVTGTSLKISHKDANMDDLGKHKIVTFRFNIFYI